MKKYSYVVLLGISLITAGTVWGAMILTGEKSLDAKQTTEWILATSSNAEEDISSNQGADIKTTEPIEIDIESTNAIEDRESIESTENVEDTANTEQTESQETAQENLENEGFVQQGSEADIANGDVSQEATEGVQETTEEVQETSKAFSEADITYFDDALFIGDSRTVGLSEYGDLGNADVFADTGMSVFKIFGTEISVKSTGKVTLETLLSQKQYGKIYIMLGINEMGYPYESTVSKYQKLVDTVRELQPSALIFLQANLHVTKEKSEKNPMYSNEKINQLNQAIYDMTDGETIFYVDINEVFDDAEGNLSTEYTVDNAHVLGKYYADWSKWLLTKTIQ